MSGELLFVALFCVVPIIIFGLVEYGLIQRMYHFREVLSHGVKTEVVVVRKYERSPSYGWRKRVAFEYCDASGAIHRKDEAASPSEYDRLQAGNTIKVLYSAKRPYVFAFKEAVEQSCAAMAHEKERQQDGSTGES